MNTSPVAGLVRAWVDLYTRGVPEPARSGRRDEVEDDLWCQHEEAAAIGRSSASVNAEMLVRLLFGMAADVGWRMSSGGEGGPELERVPSTQGRILGILAILGVVGWGIALAGYVVWGGENAWLTAGILVYVSQLLGGLGFAGATMGLALTQDRLSFVGAMAGVLGGLAALFGALGAFQLSLLLPLGSGVMAWDLGRARVVSRRLAIAHSMSGILTLPLLVALLASTDPSLIGVAFLALMNPYLLSWLGIGVSLVRGLPSPREGDPAPHRPF
jgi:hypothetical protein